MKPVFRLFLFMFATSLLTVSLSEETCQARGPFDGFGSCAGCNNYRVGDYGMGAGFFEMPYAMGRIPTPPYFALHPPVHYSDFVARTYGYSPFAYPGTFETPAVLQVTPAEISNPYVKPGSTSRVDKIHHVVSAPLPVVIRNPFVHQSQSSVGDRVAQVE